MNTLRPVMPVSETMVTPGTIAVGYINAELLTENRLELVRRGLHAWTGALGIDLVTVLIEQKSSVRLELRDLHDEVHLRGARYVVVPGLIHFSEHPLLQGERVDSIQQRRSVTVLPIDAYTTAAFLAP